MRGNHEAQPIRRRDEAEGERDNADHGEVDRIHADALRQRFEHGSDDDDRRDGVEEAADDEEHAAMKEADGDRPHVPTGHAGEQGALGIW